MSATPWRPFASRRALGVWRCGDGALSVRIITDVRIPCRPRCSALTATAVACVISCRSQLIPQSAAGWNVQVRTLASKIADQYSVSQMEDSQYKSLTSRIVHFPLWYPALIFALAGVASLDSAAASRSARRSSPRRSWLGCWGWRWSVGRASAAVRMRA